MNTINAGVNTNINTNAAKGVPFKENIIDKYQDPLMRWPLKGCAYSNELGAAIHSLSPKLGTLLWVPALMYFGADIYDKYKNDETAYSPSKKRGFKEAVFQALASVFLPTAAVDAGQRAASTLSRFTKTGLSAQSRLDVLEKSQDFLASSSSIKDYKEGFGSIAANSAKAAKSSFKALSPLKKVLAVINPLNDSDNMALANASKLGSFAKKQSDKIAKMYEQLLQNEKPAEMSKKLFKKFQASKTDYADIMEAAKAALKDFHKSQIFKNKMIKTIGGFIGLGLMMKPIDDFVEHIVIKKTVEPGLDYLSENYQYGIDFLSEGCKNSYEAFKKRIQKKQEITAQKQTAEVK